MYFIYLYIYLFFLQKDLFLQNIYILKIIILLRKDQGEMCHLSHLLNSI